MSLIIRPVEQNDTESCGKIGYEAHKTISSAHGYPSEQLPTIFLANLPFLVSQSSFTYESSPSSSSSDHLINTS